VHRSWITRDFASNKINEMIFLTNGRYIPSCIFSMMR
jgi:hypothetical protein